MTKGSGVAGHAARACGLVTFDVVAHGPGLHLHDAARTVCFDKSDLTRLCGTDDVALGGKLCLLKFVS
ncbi:MAG: hypothetical protein ABJQ67_11020 [Marinobacter sp.]